MIVSFGQLQRAFASFGVRYTKRMHDSRLHWLRQWC